MTTDTKAATDELLPCAFCGSRAMNPSRNQELWWISCTHCEAEMGHGVKATLIEHWNRRPTATSAATDERELDFALLKTNDPRPYEIITDAPSVQVGHVTIKFAQARSAEAGRDALDAAARIVRDVAELPNRSSPEDWPEAMLVTAAELTSIVHAALSSEAKS